MIELHVTFGDMETAKNLVRKALEARLAGCVNILPNVKSLYWWNGEILEDDEVVAILKTQEDSADELAALIEEIHPYKVPAIIRHERISSNPAYGDWIARARGETAA